MVSRQFDIIIKRGDCMIRASLVANSASLGLNWIYNMSYLKKITEDKEPVFWPIDPEVYEKSRKGYLAYPNHEVGDLSLQGNLLVLLYKKLIADHEYTPNKWREDLYDYIRPGGEYEGWVESYGLDLVLKILMEKMYKKNPVVNTTHDDDQLVGFVPFLVFKALHTDLSKALEFVKVLSAKTDYIKLYEMFDVIYERSTSLENMKVAIRDAILLAPQHFQKDLEMAITMEDTDQFIIEYSGTACNIHHAVPLIIHLLYFAESYEDAIKKNTVIGGASSDRGLLVGGILGKVSKVPETWIKTVLKRTPLF